jgi:hypothetical protein
MVATSHRLRAGDNLARSSTMRCTMSFAIRAVISVLTGIGAGALGFWVTWRCLVGSTFDSVGEQGYDAWLIAGMFVPGMLITLVVFHLLSRMPDRQAAVGQQ